MITPTRPTERITRTRLRWCVLAAVHCALIAGCGGDVIVEGIDLDLQIDAPFVNEASIDAKVVPDETAGFSSVEGAVQCVRVDLTNSYAAVTSADSNDAAPFTLTATIVGGSDEVRMFTWTGTLETSQTQTLFSSNAITLDDRAEDALTTVYQDGQPWTLRLDLDSPATVSVRIAPRLIVNTAAGGCN